MQTLLSVCVFLMMLCIGLDFSWGQCRQLLRNPRPIYVGLVAQNLLIPAIAFAVAWYFRESTEIALAIILIVASPGGPIANAMVHYAGARIDLSLSLTAINGMLCLITAPLIADLGFWLVSGKESGLVLPLGPTMRHLFVIILLPIVIGSGLTHFAHPFAKRLRVITRYATITLLTGTLLVFFFIHIERIHVSLGQGLIALSVLCLLMMAFGMIHSRLCGLNETFSFAIANEVSVHNVPLALLMAEGILKRPELSGTIILYVPVIFLIALGAALLYRNRCRTTVS